MARMQEARETPTPRRSPRSPAAKSAASENKQLLQDYQNALQFMQQGKFEKARALFEKLSRDAPPEVLERSRVYLAVCERNAKDPSLTFKTPEERYDYAVSLLNSGSYEEARDQFEAILDAAPNADFAHYGMALLSSITGQAEEALDHLGRAIQLNPANRIQARSDPDFIDMADDPRFTELLYPETS
ncbi:MAG: tetratricopeptide repeat protein [Acidobacteriaceae bacterium]|jgi:tetratricopeptide (TPR) repeat protein